eukprot:391871_1
MSSKTIQVKHGAHKYVIHVDESWSLSELKQIIEHMSNVPMERQKLLRKGRVMKNDEDVLKLKNRGTIMLIGSAETAPPNPVVSPEEKIRGDFETGCNKARKSLDSVSTQVNLLESGELSPTRRLYLELSETLVDVQQSLDCLHLPKIEVFDDESAESKESRNVISDPKCREIRKTLVDDAERLLGVIDSIEGFRNK